MKRKDQNKTSVAMAPLYNSIKSNKTRLNSLDRSASGYLMVHVRGLIFNWGTQGVLGGPGAGLRDHMRSTGKCDSSLNDF